MSLLKTIKGTFKNVQDDLSESFKALTVSPESKKVLDVHPSPVTTVSYDAGAEILHRNEIVWKDLYQFSEVTSQKAQDVDVQIGKLFVYVDKESESILKVHSEVSGLPKIIIQLQDITNILAQVEEEYDKVEAALVHLENVCEEQEYQRNVKSHHNQLAVYKMKKQYELNNYKVQLAKDHARKVEEINKRKQHMLHEKHVAYEEEFVKDVDYFKKHGKPGRLPNTPDSVKKLDLSEVEIEEDNKELDAFLESDTPTSDVKDSSQLDSPTESEEPNTEIIPEITSPDSTSEVTSPVDSSDEVTSPTDAKDKVTSPDSSSEVSSPVESKDEVTSPIESNDGVTSPVESRDGVTSPESKEMTSPDSENQSETNASESVNKPEDK
ncbi:Dysbindin [Mactra antiquata]